MKIETSTGEHDFAKQEVTNDYIPKHPDEGESNPNDYEDENGIPSEGKGEGDQQGEGSGESKDECQCDGEEDGEGKCKECGKKKKKQAELKKDEGPINFKFSSAEVKLETLIKAGLRNLWLVGPAGCGKTTMTRNVAKDMDLPCLVISCGLGTSSAEFIGYKYPTRESTRFADFYKIPSIILLDEFTALDPSVAQVANSALANGILNTTTGIIERHPDCIIIATSNTFGSGADRQYVANNQLDSSTIDRFIGGIIEVGYSSSYESRFDPEVVDYTALLRLVIEKHSLRRVASTRMIIEADKIKKFGVQDWREHMIVNWNKTEKKLLGEFIHELEEMEKAIKEEARKKEELRLLEEQKAKVDAITLEEWITEYITKNVISTGSYVKIVNRESNNSSYPFIIKDRHDKLFKIYCESKEHAIKVHNVIKERIKFLSTEPKEIPSEEVEVSDVDFVEIPREYDPFRN